MFYNDFTMRLWHKDLIEKLPRAQLLGQHREVCAPRAVVDMTDAADCPEHNADYLAECLENLAGKGAQLIDDK